MTLNEEVEKMEAAVIGDVSWSYPDGSAEAAPLMATAHPKPPHYHGNLFCHWDERRYGCRGEEDAELNAELLPGMMSVEDTLQVYEAAVGIVPPPIIKPQEEVLWRAVTNEDMFARTHRWAELVKDLVAGPLYRIEAGTSGESTASLTEAAAYLTQSLDERSPSSSESVDLTDSEHSVDSDPVPSTPKQRSYATVTSPGVFEFSPSKPISLSASASAFVPTSTPNKGTHFPAPLFTINITPSPSPPLTNFTFPTLPPTLKKDEQGFYTEVPLPSASRATQRALATASSQLPSFLTGPAHRHPRGKASKTREMVEQLRSASAGDVDRPFGLSDMSTPVRPVSTPLQMDLFGERSVISDAETHSDAAEDSQEDGDGWMRGDLTDADDHSSEAKARRTRNLVHALGRKRGDSDSTHEEMDANHHLALKATTTEQGRAPSVAEDSSESHVQGPSSSPAPRRRSSRHRSRKSHRSNGSSSVSSPAVPPPMPLPSLSLPTLAAGPPPMALGQQYFAPPFPSYAAHPYVFSATAPGPGFKPVPMHMQMPAPNYFGAAYHPMPPYGGMGMYGPLPHPHPAAMQMQPVPVAPGATFGRVAQW
ncbi:hypothetical protein HWV62_43987 [Athelia sp. TMB]|nr:hypothetical protein HWV62_43987 [Athelia sp. TMB]